MPISRAIPFNHLPGSCVVNVSARYGACNRLKCAPCRLACWVASTSLSHSRRWPWSLPVPLAPVRTRHRLSVGPDRQPRNGCSGSRLLPNAHPTVLAALRAARFGHLRSALLELNGECRSLLRYSSLPPWQSRQPALTIPMSGTGQCRRLEATWPNNRFEPWRQRSCCRQGLTSRPAPGDMAQRYRAEVLHHRGAPGEAFTLGKSKARWLRQPAEDLRHRPGRNLHGPSASRMEGHRRALPSPQTAAAVEPRHLAPALCGVISMLGRRPGIKLQPEKAHLPPALRTLQLGPPRRAPAWRSARASAQNGTSMSPCSTNTWGSTGA